MRALGISPFTFGSPPSFDGCSYRDYRDYCCPDTKKGLCIGVFRLDRKKRDASGEFSANAGSWCWTDVIPWGVGYAVNLIPVLFPSENASAFMAWLQSLANVSLGSLTASGNTYEYEPNYKEECAGCRDSQTTLFGTRWGYVGGTLGEFSFGENPFYFQFRALHGWFYQETRRFSDWEGAKRVRPHTQSRTNSTLLS